VGRRPVPNNARLQLNTALRLAAIMDKFKPPSNFFPLSPALSAVFFPESLTLLKVSAAQSDASHFHIYALLKVCCMDSLQNGTVFSVGKML
jgi:hypothetical protein